LANPISQSADVTSITTPGDIIGISGTSPLALSLAVQVQAYEIATSTTTTIINNNYIGGTPYSSSFGTSIGYIYTILVTDEKKKPVENKGSFKNTLFYNYEQ
jgi:hypothetical protein